MQIRCRFNEHSSWEKAKMYNKICTYNDGISAIFNSKTDSMQVFLLVSNLDKVKATIIVNRK